MALICIVVPVYKVEPYIHRCIDSILSQTFRDFTLVIVDDGSPDQCGMICDEYAAKDSRIVVIHRENGGLSAARNSGIEWSLSNSSSQYLTFIDSDDWVHPQFIEVLVNSINNSEAQVSMVGYVYTDTYPDHFEQYDSLAEPEVYNGEDLFMRREWDFNYAWGKLYRKTDFQTLRYPEGKNFEDVFTTYQVIFAQEQIALVDEPLYYYFRNEDGISHSVWKPSELVILEGMRNQMDYYQANGYLRAFEKEERLYVNHYAYQLVRIRQNRADWSKNKVYWKQLRSEMFVFIKEHSDKYNRDTMPQCYDAAYPYRTRLRQFLSNLQKIWSRGGITGIMRHTFNRLRGK